MPILANGGNMEYTYIDRLKQIKSEKKITNEEFQRIAKMRGIKVTKARTNQEERDAGLIALTQW